MRVVDYFVPTTTAGPLFLVALAIVTSFVNVVDGNNKAECPPRCYNNIGKNCNDPQCQPDDSNTCEYTCGETIEHRGKCHVPICASWCLDIKPDDRWDGICSKDSFCRDCSFCDSSANFVEVDPNILYGNNNNNNNNQQQQSRVCPIVSFQDVTSLKIPDDWKVWLHSGKPYLNEGHTTLVDINNDGVLDYFYNMHGHPFKDKECGFRCPPDNERMELGESMLVRNSDGDDYYTFKKVSHRVINTEDADGADIQPQGGGTGNPIGQDYILHEIDPHGRVMMDLDNDGYNDILIASGGGMGQPIGDSVNDDPVEYEARRATRDNFLYWGEPSDVDVATTTENDNDGEKTSTTVYYKGGRHKAKLANVHMRMGRGRIIYVFDMNNDGLLDIFMLADRRGDNTLVPGVLLYNQGNRTWSKTSPTSSSVADPSFTSSHINDMSEFTRTMILTDADGDGVANEIVLVRAFCYPQRANPDADHPVKYYGPTMKDLIVKQLDSFPEDVLDFCSTRPVGTIAVYKYNSDTEQIEEISPRYQGLTHDDLQQPVCCPHGTWDSAMDCNARSLASADLDNDLKSDLLMLYGTKLHIFLSSDRPQGILPIGLKYVSQTIHMSETCDADSLLVTDFDNDSEYEILIACHQPGKFLLYTRNRNNNDEYSDWTLDNNCNIDGTLGDLRNRALYDLTDQDYKDACDFDEKLAEEGRKPFPITRDACKFYKYNQTGEMPPDSKKPPKRLHQTLAGINVADLNNDGYMDLVAKYESGYVRFMQNNAATLRKKNKFIVFQLVGSPDHGVNKYGIGSTLILQTMESGSNPPKHKSFLKEYNTYAHGTDHYNSVDPRIMYGLSDNLEPIQLTVIWPNGVKKIYSLSNKWEFTSSSAKPFIISYSDQINNGGGNGYDGHDDDGNVAVLLAGNYAILLPIVFAGILIGLCVLVCFRRVIMEKEKSNEIELAPPNYRDDGFGDDLHSNYRDDASDDQDVFEDEDE